MNNKVFLVETPNAFCLVFFWETQEHVIDAILNQKGGVIYLSGNFEDEDLDTNNWKFNELTQSELLLLLLDRFN